MVDGSLSENELARYARQLTVPAIGVLGQHILKSSKVLVVGAGGLGSPIISYLAAAGVGVLGIADFDKVHISNYQRQILYTADDEGHSKVQAAAKRVRGLNCEIELRLHEVKLAPENATEICSQYDVIMDGCDNFSTRQLLNDTCFALKKPFVHGAVKGFEGQASSFLPPAGPCYRCAFPEPMDGFADTAPPGVVGVLPGIIGSIQAAECLKLLLSIGEPLNGKILLFDARVMKFTTVKIKRNVTCTICGEY